MMQELKHSIWQARGKQPGKSVTIIGGTHGNERTGVEVISKLKVMIESSELKIGRGILTLIHGNPRAIEVGERGSLPHADLNRSYQIDLLNREALGTYEDDRAREIAPFLQASDVVIDLHATNKPSEPFIACLHSSHHQEVYRWFASEKVLADPNFVLGGEPVTTDEYTEAHGGIGVCYETGQVGDLTRVDEVTQNVIDLLVDQGLVDGSAQTPSGEREIYEVVEPIVLTGEGFEFVGGFGERSWESFLMGQTLGHHGSIPFIAFYDGVIVFPKISEHRQVGKEVAFLAKKVSLPN